MASYTIFKLKNLTPLHMGTGRENYDFSAESLHSDTISSALAAIRAQNGKSDDILDFMNSFVVSSAFPFAGDRFFFPKPMCRFNMEKNLDYICLKKLKKVRYVEAGIWGKMIQGLPIAISVNQLQGKYLTDNSEVFQAPSCSQVTQRVSVPRDGEGDSEPFFFDWSFFRKDSGLFCVVQAESSVIEELKNLFEELGQTGIGTDKNVGGGRFDVELAELEIPQMNDAAQSMTLSMYLPKKEELADLNLGNSSYELSLRGGYLAGSTENDFRHLRKKSVYMFKPGSVFETGKRLEGKVVDLKPEWDDERMHPVFRSGKPLSIPVKMN